MVREVDSSPLEETPQGQTQQTAIFTYARDGSNPEGKEQPKHARRIHGMKSGWAKVQHVTIENGKITVYRMDLNVMFVLDLRKSNGGAVCRR
jgi:hypothetical protein